MAERRRKLRPVRVVVAVLTALVLATVAAVALRIGPGNAAELSAAAESNTVHHSAAPKGKWIKVDKKAWQAQLAEFKKVKPRKVPATAKQNPEFNATCKYSHSGKNDPIVFPGQKGKSHMHSFVGNRKTNATTTPASLMKFTATSCVPKKDFSSYWVPTLTSKKTGKAVQPSEFIVYYGSLLDDKNKKKTMPMPNGMRMIYGDASKQVKTPAGSRDAFYCSGGPVEGKTRSTDGNWPVCGDGGTVHFMMRYPDCWDGKHLDSPDHKSHVAYGSMGDCPKSHPVRIPAITKSIYYPTGGSKEGFTLSSGMASSMHGDVFIAWDTKTMADRVKSCVRQLVTCASNGKF
ncbi:DUF1996 domain-containing protein [Kineosporia rhizophila]|uniref:DUF1996 domain-containing protein n=1 Tax=Kineosporia TaxID=49184 RepID=UPI001E2D00CC|nr:DUF1996 domain-containing protein [Kineosporia sp. NBRC 101677]MCE0540815.1 DUF1996 domain-containing protein [Kineosporia rhizophila]GLY18143.1 hypothetical protein Kisp01_51570 [Kineosporia sp. NBRC 101677]